MRGLGMTKWKPRQESFKKSSESAKIFDESKNKCRSTLTRQAVARK